MQVELLPKVLDSKRSCLAEDAEQSQFDCAKQCFRAPECRTQLHDRFRCHFAHWIPCFMKLPGAKPIRVPPFHFDVRKGRYSELRKGLSGKQISYQRFGSANIAQS